MAYGIVYENGTSPTITAISVPVGSSIAMRTTGTASYAQQATSNPNVPPIWGAQVYWTNGQVVVSNAAGTVPLAIQIYAQAAPVLYDVGTTPNVVVPLVQRTPAAKTTSTTLTVAEVIQGIITVNQGAAGASALQLPLAASMDTQFPDWSADNALEFSLINISTVAAEDASITTNTGWTLVGNMDVASNAAAADKSAGRFRARKTAAGAWTLYRLS